MRTWAAVLVVGLAFPLGAQTPWHHDLSHAGGGYWRTRAAIAVSNTTGEDAAGRPVELRLGTKPGELAFVGQRVAALRLCDPAGGELLWDLVGTDGEPKREGTLAAGDRLFFGVECKSGGKATYFAYAANPEALPVAEYLGAARPFENGGFEKGAGDTPRRWHAVETDGEHRMTWATDSPRSGTRCARCDVDAGAAPSWVKYIQEGIRILPDADYRLEAWVKAKGARGRVGWFVHVHGEKPMVVNKAEHGGEGTYDWRKVTIDFHTPPDAVKLTVGTVLRGTGTAWYDDATLTLRTKERPPLRAVAGKPERRSLAVAPAPADWRVRRASHRVDVTVRNWGGQATRPLVHVRLGPLTRRLPLALRDVPPRVVDPATGQAVAALRMEQQVVFAADVLGTTEKTYHAYFAPPPRLRLFGTRRGMHYADLVASRANLVKNPSFEQGEPLPDQWVHSAQSDRPAQEISHASRDRDAHGGTWCAKLVVPPKAPLGWPGWHQDIAVRPSTAYLYAAWLRSEDVEGGVQIHGHSHKADGTLCDASAFFSAGPKLVGTQGWTLLTALIRTPTDCATVKLHLTMNAHGTVWHDDIFFGEAAHALVGATQPRRALADRAAQRRGYTAWLVDPIVKVFQDDLPGETATRVELAAARNECEVFQLALRSVRDLDAVAVAIEPPRGRDGTSLPVELHKVGYVRVDHPSSYYRCDVPAWYRKRPPTGRTGCDGWAGMWPDPLAPYRGPFKLAAHTTQPLWATVRVPEDAKAGVYRGLVTVRPAGAPAMEIPVRVTVRDFAIPKASHLKVIYDLREHGARAFGGASGTRQEVMTRWYKLMADHRVCPGILPSPKFTRSDDGRYAMDATDFDRAAATCFDELGMNVAYTPWWFYSFGWARTPRKLFGFEPFTPEHTEAYTACLKLYLDHVRKKGWLDKITLYVSDEPHFRHEHIREQMIKVCRMIQGAWPEAPIYSSTWRHCPEWNGRITVWGFGPQGTAPVELMEERKKAGDILWFTTDGQMCLDTPYCAIERLLPWFCWKYGVEAYEFWGVDWYTYDPWDYGFHRFIHQSSDGVKYFHVRYPNGDGYLAYPGKRVGVDGPVSSVRLAQAREGVEDYEYLYLLDQLIAKAKKQGLSTRSAERTRARARELVAIPNAGGRYSTRILPDPSAVARHRAALADAIERLARRLR